MKRVATFANELIIVVANSFDECLLDRFHAMSSHIILLYLATLLPAKLVQIMLEIFVVRHCFNYSCDLRPLFISTYLLITLR